MRRNEDYPSYYYKDIEGTAEIGLERSAGEPFRELKIYGDSVQNGTPSPDNPIKVESVGEKTANLVSELIDGYVNIGDAYPSIYNDKKGVFKTIHIQGQKAGSYTFSFEKAVSIVRGVSPNHHDANVSFSCGPRINTTYTVVTITEDEDFYISFRDTTNAQWGEAWVQCVEGSYTADTIPDYEPYGYRVPIEVSNGKATLTTNIYLKEPLSKIGDYADELDVNAEKVTRNIFEYTFTGDETWVGPQVPLDTTIRSIVYYNTMPRIRSGCSWVGFSEKGIFDGISTVSGDAERCQFSNYRDTYSAFYARILKSRCAEPENPVISDFTNIYTPGTKVYGVRETSVEEPILLSDEIKTLKRDCQLRVKTSLSPSKVKAQYYRY